MTIVCISDTHEKEFPEIPNGDILIHCGDFTGGKHSILALEALNEWFKTLPHKYKILVPGNHDFCFETHEKESREIITEAIILINESIEIEGIKLYGTPDQPWFYNWAFNKYSEELIESYNKIPEATDILITHTPPYGILDMVLRGEQVGSKELLCRIQEIKPKLSVFGHIHESYGTTKIDETTFINCAICNLGYKPINKPLVFELKEKE